MKQRSKAARSPSQPSKAVPPFAKTRDSAADTGRGSSQADRLRVRAAWMYYIEQLTQNEIAEKLGVGRVTVVRLLADARARNEVSITINPELKETVALERRLEGALGMDKAVVVPLSSPEADPVPAISAATGEFISRLAASNMRIGVGWGRTLFSSLASIRGQSLSGFKVYSLLGGIIQARRFNPAEFAWQLAELFQGEGYLVPAPAIVDSVATKRSLIERCGLDTVFEMAEDLDAVLVSVGGVTEGGTSRRVGYLSDGEFKSAIDAGAVGDLLLHFFDEAGRLIEHDLNDRVMSVPIERLRRAPIRVLASGGRDKLAAVAGGIRLIAPTTLITDEVTARALLGEPAD